MSFEKDEYMSHLVAEIKKQSDQAISDMLNVAIEKGYISVRQSNPVLIQEYNSDKISLKHSLVIDYLGAERIEELEKENEYLKKLNSDLHNALSDFYEKTKVNTWLKNQSGLEQ